MTDLFSKCINIVLKHEGGFQANPNDRGNYVNGILVGTKYGIAARFFPDEDIKNMTEQRAKEIYYQSYWKPMNLEGIQDELSVLHIFDHGINAGRKTSIILAQKIVQVKPDGVCGNITKQAINGWWTFKDDFISARIEYYKKVALKGNNKVFLNGWIRRVEKTYFI